MLEILGKKQMYDALLRGEFGNIIPQFFSTWEWQDSVEYKKYEYWGIRSALESKHPGCKMNVKREDVIPHLREHMPSGYNISVMLERIPGVEITAWLEVFTRPKDITEDLFGHYDSDQGIEVCGFEYPLKENHFRSWRSAFQQEVPNHWTGLDAWKIIRKYLNPSSLDDLEGLIERYSPGHVIEMSTLNQCLGTVPRRNAVIWEVRKY